MANIVPILCDEDIDKYITDNKYNIYFREGNSGAFELSDGFSADDIKDATTHGFEFVASDEPVQSRLESTKYDDASVYDDREMER